MGRWAQDQRHRSRRVNVIYGHRIFLVRLIRKRLKRTKKRRRPQPHRRLV